MNGPAVIDSSDTIAAILADLDAAERGVVLGLLVMGIDEPQHIAESIAGPAGRRCVAAAAAFAALPRPERLRHASLLARQALSAMPAGIEAVHADTLRCALEVQSDETIRMVTAVASARIRAIAAQVLDARRGAAPAIPGGQAAAQGHAISNAGAPSAEAVAELQRAVFAPIVAVPPVAPGSKASRWGRQLALAPEALLMNELTGAGADALATSFAGADPATLRQAAARLSSPWADRLFAAAPPEVAVSRSVGDGESGQDGQDGQGGHEATERRRGRTPAGVVADILTAVDPQRPLERLGARALGERLAGEDPDHAVAVAQRLRADLASELLAGAAAESQRAPSP